MQRLRVAVAILSALVATPAQDVRSTLTGLRCGTHEVPFDTPTRLLAQRIASDAATRRFALENTVWLRVRQIDGQALPPSTFVLARAGLSPIDAACGKTAEGDWLQLEGVVQDALDFGGSTHLSFEVRSAQRLRREDEPPMAPPEAAPDLGTSIGRRVTLDGKLWSLNGAWWLSHGDEDLMLANAQGRRRDFPREWHGHRVRVQGRVERQLRLPLNPAVFTDVDGTWPMVHVLFDSDVRTLEAAVEGTEGNRHRDLYTKAPRLRDGVFDLLAATPRWRNYDPTDTAARLFAARNSPWLQELLRESSPAMRDVMARRMDDAGRHQALRTLYAGLLAAHDDRRGRDALRKRLEQTPEDPDALYVLGAFATWREDQRCDESWAEEIALQCLQKAPATTARYSDVPDLLVRIGSRRGIEVMVGLLTEEPRLPKSDFWPAMSESERVLRALMLAPQDRVSDEVLVRIARMTSPSERTHRWIAGVLLRRDAAAAVDVFLPQLAEPHWERTFFEEAGPRVLAEIERRLPALAGPQRTCAARLLRMRAEDAVPRTLAMLADPRTPTGDLTGLCSDLGRLGATGPGAVPAARALQRVLADQESKTTRWAIGSVLDFIASSSERDAIAAMIDLLTAECRVRGDPPFAQSWLRNYVAGCLAEMTGRSFGVDAALWRRWLADSR